MFRSLKLRIYLLSFVPFVLIAIVGLYIQLHTLKAIDEEVSTITEQAIIEIEKNRLVTVIDSALSIIQEDLDLPGEDGLNKAMSLLTNYKFDNGNGYLFAYDSQGTRVMNGRGVGIGENFINSKDKADNYIVKNVLAAAKTGNGFTTYYFPKPGETQPSAKYSYSVWIDQWDIAIATGFFIDSTEGVLANINNSLKETEKSSATKNLVIIALLSAIVALIVFVSIKTIFNCLMKLHASVESLADGEGDLSTKLPNSPIDLLDNIANNFNHFLDSMAADITNLKDSSNILGGIAEQSIQRRKKLEDASEKQISETTLIATAIEEMSSTSIEIAQNADLTRSSAESAEQEIQDVLHQVQMSSDELTDLNNVLTGVEDSIQELGGNVEAINSVLSVIQGISEQTNLLALNAAIEAARAGELGRGFAVVADEVRTLAQRSQQSTVEIKDILEKLQLSADKTIKDMSSSADKRTAVVDAMEKIKTIIHSSTESIKNLTQMNIQVSISANEQTTVVNEMARGINGIASLAEVIGSGSHDASVQFARLEQQSELIHEVTNKFKV